jgi:glycosyltransferase involved in cell wall biosynthesis
LRLDIVMPAHNEQERIDRTLRAYRAACPDDGVRFLVALDSCSDARPRIVDEHATAPRGSRSRG